MAKVRQRWVCVGGWGVGGGDQCHELAAGEFPFFDAVPAWRQAMGLGSCCSQKHVCKE